MTTCAAITVVNLALYVAWRNPRLWRTMNRNFLLSAGVPQPASMLGAVFSHQFWLSHLLGNTLLLFVVGMPLHDEIGRLNFLALYLGVGVAGSLASLYWNVLRRNLLVATLGASGATSGLVGAYFAVSPRRDLYVPFTNVVVPYDSWLAIVGFVVLEGFTMWRSGGKLFDHPAHLGGLAAGVVAGWALRLGSPKADVELEGHAPRGAETRLDGGES
jgi:rhomboid-like protein